MSAITEMVMRLIAVGTPPDVAATVVTEAFAAGVSVRNSTGIPVDESAERRRSYDRERKRQSAEIRRKSAEIRGISETALTESPLDKIPKEKKEKKVSRKIGIPAEWKPSASHFEAAAKLGTSEAQVLSKAEDMRIWAGANGALKVDWDLTFHGFLRRDASKLTGNSTGNSNGKTPQRGSLTAVIDRKLAELERQESSCDPLRENPPRLLSHG